MDECLRCPDEMIDTLASFQRMCSSKPRWSSCPKTWDDITMHGLCCWELRRRWDVTLLQETLTEIKDKVELDDLAQCKGKSTRITNNWTCTHERCVWPNKLRFCTSYVCWQRQTSPGKGKHHPRFDKATKSDKKCEWDLNSPSKLVTSVSNSWRHTVEEIRPWHKAVHQKAKKVCMHTVIKEEWLL